MTFQSFTGREYLKIDIANHMGLDKLTWDERITWFDANENSLETLIDQADEPALYYAGVKAWREVQAGEPTGYMISLDATSSGLQILAALTGDGSAAELCNVTGKGQRMDAYTAIYRAMLDKIDDSAKIDRDGVKQAIMTSLYGSTAVPKDVFGEGYLLQTFYDTMKELAPAAWELNEAFLALWDPEALENSWVLPDNFHVRIKVMDRVKETVHFLNQPFDVYYNVNTPIENGRSLGANIVHSIDGMIVREMTRRCTYDPAMPAQIRKVLEIGCGTRQETHDDIMVMTLWDHYLKSGFLSARILDHLTADNCGHVHAQTIYNLLDTLPEKPFPVISVHDCFRCHPNYGNDLRLQYNLQLTMLAQSDLLQFLISQLLDKPVKIGKLNPQLWTQIPYTNYALS